MINWYAKILSQTAKIYYLIEKGSYKKFAPRLYTILVHQYTLIS